MTGDELLDLVNDHDVVVGQIWRSETPNLGSTKAGYLRAATALIQNSSGELWIPRRSADKRIAPLGLDSSMQEHVGAGESYVDATLRGFEEELNLELTSQDIEFVGKLQPSHLVHYFVAVYLYRTDITPDYNPNDFVSASWIHTSKLLSLLKEGEPAKDSLLPSVELLLHTTRDKKPG